MRVLLIVLVAISTHELVFAGSPSGGGSLTGTGTGTGGTNTGTGTVTGGVTTTPVTPTPAPPRTAKVECYPDNTNVTVSLKDEGTTQRMIAFQSTTAKLCTVTKLNNTHFIISGCEKDKEISAYFVHPNKQNTLLGGPGTSYIAITCRSYKGTGSPVIVAMKPIVSTITPYTSMTIRPTFELTMKILDHDSPSGAAEMVVGKIYTLSITGPYVYDLSPQNCEASTSPNFVQPQPLYAGGTPKDTDLLAAFTVTKTVTGDTKHNEVHATIYGFKFINSNDLYLRCTVQVKCIQDGCMKTKRKRERFLHDVVTKIRVIDAMSSAAAESLLSMSACVVPLTVAFAVISHYVK